jgi:DNA-binding NarL/FixJ family response regulator
LKKAPSIRLFLALGFRSQQLPLAVHLNVSHLVKINVEGIRVPGRSVLIVDDNQVVRQALCDLFTREGDFDVCGEAEDGREGVEKAQMLQPDLIVTDLSMPVMNGLEETRILKKVMPTVPVIIFTAHSDPFVEKEAAAAGVSAVVSKSQAVTVLVATARSLLDEIAP